MDCKTALQTVLDQVDYQAGACGVTEMVGAVLPKEVIGLARKAIADEAEATKKQTAAINEAMRFLIEFAKDVGDDHEAGICCCDIVQAYWGLNELLPLGERRTNHAEPA